MKPHKLQAYITGFLLGCIIVGTLLSFRMVKASTSEEKIKAGFKPIPPEKLISQKDPIHPSLALMANTKDSAHHILILEDIFPNQFIRVEESLDSNNKLIARKVLMADRLNLRLKSNRSKEDLEPVLKELQAEVLESSEAEDNVYPIKLLSHSPHSLEIALTKIEHHKDLVEEVEKIELSR